MWNFLLWLDCWITDKWTGRSWEYYSAVLGGKKMRGVLGNNWRQERLAYMLDWIDKNHCTDAMRAALPSRKLEL